MIKLRRTVLLLLPYIAEGCTNVSGAGSLKASNAERVIEMLEVNTSAAAAHLDEDLYTYFCEEVPSVSLAERVKAPPNQAMEGIRGKCGFTDIELAEMTYLGEHRPEPFNAEQVTAPFDQACMKKIEHLH